MDGKKKYTKYKHGGAKVTHLALCGVNCAYVIICI